MVTQSYRSKNENKKKTKLLCTSQSCIYMQFYTLYMDRYLYYTLHSFSTTLTAHKYICIVITRSFSKYIYAINICICSLKCNIYRRLKYSTGIKILMII